VAGAFFYHSVEGKEIVVIVEVIREHYPDATAKSGEPWVVVDVKAIEPFGKPVTLVEARAAPGLKQMVLVNNTRLSVQPVAADEWKLICKMGGMTK
jgi:predicted RNA-binding protein with PUA-like domain